MNQDQSSNVKVAASHHVFQNQAQQLAVDLGLAYVKVVADPKRCDYAQLLYVTDKGLQLQQCGKKAPGPVWVDYVTGAVAHRRKFGGGSGQMIAKAVGIKSGIRPSVLDVTAGLGKDAFVLATLGCEVQMIERSPIVHALLADGIQRAELNFEIMDIIQRMHLHCANSIEHMQQCEAPQVVYVDPMFPHVGKSASVKKEMLIFRDVVGDDLDAGDLLAQALETAQARVVVKRPRKAPCIEVSGLALKPSYVLEGKSSRYDIYALKKLQ
ncbi:MAG: class I SAM-dependent methyltransferase [Oceanospirillaceae bacterium]|nr:class I SAM-dependent methyltransferase [Oceanospirillaceae bacterium]